MRRTIRRGFTVTLIFVMMLAASCTKSGDIIYQQDPADQASTTPLVMVIYDPNALGDRSYNDLIYQGVEKAAQDNGLRTMQLSPASVEEGLTYLRMMLQTMTNPSDTVHRLLIVAAASYDDYLRRNNSLLDANPHADLLYFETDIPLEGKGSTFYMPYYGAMYEAGAITQVETTDVLLVGANPYVKPVADAMQAYSDGFLASPIATSDQPEKNLVTVWLSNEVSGGFSVSDTTVIRLLTGQQWQGDHHLLVPVCGGSATNFRRLIEMFNIYDFVGIDCEAVSAHCNFSVVKHIDRVVEQCIGQWLSPSGMLKHQTFGDPVTELKAGTPYIIKWENGDDIVNPVFNSVVIDANKHYYDTYESGVITDERVRFMGTYTSMKFSATDNSILLLGGDNMLYYPTTGAGLDAQHAYFKLGGDGVQRGAQRVTRFSINFGDGGTTGVIAEETSEPKINPSDAWYTIGGIKLEEMPTQKGEYINNGIMVVIE